MNDVVRWFSTFFFFFSVFFHRRHIPAGGHSIRPATGNICGQGISDHHTFLRSYSRKFFQTTIKEPLTWFICSDFLRYKAMCKIFQHVCFFEAIDLLIIWPIACRTQTVLLLFQICKNFFCPLNWYCLLYTSDAADE